MNGYIYVDPTMPGFDPDLPDATYYDWYGDPIEIQGNEGRTDLEYDSSGRRVPKRSAPEKIMEAILATPGSAIILGLFVLAVIFSAKVK